ncbi:TetR/AcrR family transcriptional regulator [Paraburkholderia bengalensis]|uniref:TetR/AcrR family transcriptional regulator n=1 Tax=Paraburkholderia bengalensis TaxID=2747562 RepID=A0ABU8J3P7_9BURK
MLRGRPREFDREQALLDAMLLFWRKGFHATSLRDLGDVLGIRMPSLYAAFGSKEELYVEAVDLYMQLTRTLWRHLQEAPSAREGVRELLLATAGELTNREAHPIGCMVTFATIDEDMPAVVAAAIRNARCAWLNAIRERLEIAVTEGELHDLAEASRLSHFYAAIVQSMGIQAHDGAPFAELKDIIDLAMVAWPERNDRVAAKRGRNRAIAASEPSARKRRY